MGTQGSYSATPSPAAPSTGLDTAMPPEGPGLSYWKKGNELPCTAARATTPRTTVLVYPSYYVVLLRSSDNKQPKNNVDYKCILRSITTVHHAQVQFSVAIPYGLITCVLPRANNFLSVGSRPLPACFLFLSCRPFLTRPLPPSL